MPNQEKPSNNLNPEQIRELVNDLTEKLKKIWEEDPEIGRSFEEYKELEGKHLKSKDIKIGREFLTPIQIEELGQYFKIDDEVLRDMPIEDVIILDDAYVEIYGGIHSDIEERIGLTPFEVEQKIIDLAEKIKNEYERRKRKGDSDSSPDKV